MSAICFDTKLFLFVCKQNEQARGLYSVGVDHTTSKQHLIRDSALIGNDLREELAGQSASDDQQPGKAYKYPVDGCSLSSAGPSNCVTSFGSVRDKSIALSVDLGISSSLWLLGRHCDLSNDSGVESMLQDYVSRLYTLLNEALEGGTFERRSLTIHVKCYEVFGDQIRDLVALSNPEESPVGVNFSSKNSNPRVREHPVSGAFVSGLSQRNCSTVSEAHRTLLQAYEQRMFLLSADSQSQLSAAKNGIKSAPAPHKLLGTVGSVIIILEIQQVLTATGADEAVQEVRRSASVQFNILSEIEPLTFKPAKTESIATISLGELRRSALGASSISETQVLLAPDSTTPVQVSQLAVCAKSVASLSRVVSLLQQNAEVDKTSSTNNTSSAPEAPKIQHIPYRESTLTRVLQPMLEGKYVNYIHCCLDERAELAGATLATAAYALRLSTDMKAGVRSRVVPNERFTKGAVVKTSKSGSSTVHEVVLGVLGTASLAKEAAQQASSQALESVVRATTHALDAMEIARAELRQEMDENVFPEENRTAAFWDLLNAMRAEGGGDYFDLERLQQERTRLLDSLGGVVVRADTSVAVRAQYEAANDNSSEEIDFSPFEDQDIVDDRAAAGAVEAHPEPQLHGIDSPQKLSGTETASMSTPPPQMRLGTLSTASTPEAGVALSVDRRSPLTPHNPLGQVHARPGSTPSLSRTSKLASLSPVSPLSPLSPSDPSLRPALTEKMTDASGGNIGTILMNYSTSTRSAPDILPDLQARTERSQSVKGPRAPSELSPVQAPFSSTTRNNAARALAAAGSNVSRTGSVKGSSTAGGGNRNGVRPTGPVVNTSVKIKPVPSGRTGGSASNKTSPPSTAAVAQLAPVRAGKVSVKANGLKTFDQSTASEELETEQSTSTDKFDSSSPVTASRKVSSGALMLPSGLAPLRRRGASPNTANLARQSRGVSDAVIPSRARPSPPVVSASSPATHNMRGTPNQDKQPRVATQATEDAAEIFVADGGDELIQSSAQECAVVTGDEAPTSNTAGSASSCIGEPVREAENASVAAVEAVREIAGATATSVASTSSGRLFTSSSTSLPALVSPPSDTVPTGVSDQGYVTSSKLAPLASPRGAHHSSEFIPTPETNTPVVEMHFNLLINRLEATAPTLSRKTRSSLPSERQELSPAHEDAQGSHLSELEAQYLRAVSHTVLPEVARCIRMGVDVKVKNSFGRDAMQIAARNGAPTVLTLVHEHGGEISSRGPKGDTLYHLAASNGHINVFEWLAEHIYRGAGLAGDTVDMYGQTPAHVAARRGEVEVLKYLHRNLGVDVMQEDFDGRTPLEVIPKLFLGGNAEGLIQAREFLTSVIELK